MCATDHGYELCRRKPLLQLLICHASVTLYPTCLLLVIEPQRTGVNILKRCFCSSPSCITILLHPVPGNPIPHQVHPQTASHHHPPSSKLPIIPHWSVTCCMYPYIHTCIIALISMHGHIWTRRMWAVMHKYTQMNAHQWTLNLSAELKKSTYIKLNRNWLHSISRDDEMQSHPAPVSSGGKKIIVKVRFVQTDMNPPFNPHPDYSSISASFQLSVLPSKSRTSALTFFSSLSVITIHIIRFHEFNINTCRDEFSHRHSELTVFFYFPWRLQSQQHIVGLLLLCSFT